MSKWNFKIVLAGDGAVGKTSIRERYMGKGFSASYLKTIGADFASKKIEIDDNQITFQIWDLAGQDSYQVVRRTFYKGATAGLMVFDCQDPKTLTNLKSWMDEAIKGSDNSMLVYFVIANKIDLEDERKVSREMALELCNRLATETGIRFYYCETSALTGQNINETFEYLSFKLLESSNVQDLVMPDLPDGIIDIKDAQIPKVPTVTESGEFASKNEFDQLLVRVENIEKKLNAVQTIMKKIVEKIQQ